MLDAAMGAVPPESAKAKLGTVDPEAVVSAALGLTAEEAHNAFARSIVQRDVEPELILAEKKQIVKGKRGLEWMDPLPGGVNAVGGMEILRDHPGRAEAFTKEAREYGLPRPRGVLLGGVMGCGKSHMAKAIAAMLQQPSCGSPSRTCSAVSRARRSRTWSGCSRWPRRSRPGLQHRRDRQERRSGTSMNESDNRVKGKLLTWLQECQAEVFVVAGANNIEALSAIAGAAPEGPVRRAVLRRPARELERQEILAVHLKQRQPTGVAPLELVELAAEHRGVQRGRAGGSGGGRRHVPGVPGRQAAGAGDGPAGDRADDPALEALEGSHRGATPVGAGPDADGLEAAGAGGAGGGRQAGAGAEGRDDPLLRLTAGRRVPARPPPSTWLSCIACGVHRTGVAIGTIVAIGSGPGFAGGCWAAWPASPGPAAALAGPPGWPCSAWG